MAASDYLICDKCGEKTAYDAEVDYSYVGDLQCLCLGCAEKYEVIIVEREDER